MRLFAAVVFGASLCPIPAMAQPHPGTIPATVVPLLGCAASAQFSPAYVLDGSGNVIGCLEDTNTVTRIARWRNGIVSDVTREGDTKSYKIVSTDSTGDLILRGTDYFVQPYSITLEKLSRGGLSTLSMFDPNGYAYVNRYGHMLGTTRDPVSNATNILLVAEGVQANVGSGNPLGFNDQDEFMVYAGWTTMPYYLWDHGATVPLSEPTADGTTFSLIEPNNLGHRLGTRNGIPVLWKDGAITELSGIGTPTAMNDLDQVAGTLGKGTNFDLCVWDRGVVTDLSELVDPSMGLWSLSAMSINNAGQILAYGRSQTANDFPVFLDYHGCADGDGDGNPDNDGDGLCDNWEKDGIDSNLDGVVDYVLADVNKDGVVDASEAADPNHKDLYVEIDWMAEHQPLAGALQRVVTAFANAPVSNPDGTTGVRLHVLVDEQAVVHLEQLNVRVGDPDVDFDKVKVEHFGTARERTSANAKAILAAKRLVFRYALFIHDQLDDKASGRAEVGGNDIVVSLGDFAMIRGHRRGNVDQQAGTFMHELGHTLGMQHGGLDTVNCKPNYLSVMSYSRQLDGDPIFGRKLDYSAEELPELDESNLDEAKGISGPQGDLTSYVPPKQDALPSFQLVVPAAGPIDWNDNDRATDTHVSVDITGPCSEGFQLLMGHDDWSNLKYSFRDSTDFADGAHLSLPAEELTLQFAETMSPDTDSDGVTNVHDNCMGVANPAQEDADDDGVGDACDVCPTVFNPSQAPCASLPPGGEPDDPGSPVGGVGSDGGVITGSGDADSGSDASTGSPGNGTGGAGGTAVDASVDDANSSGGAAAPSSDGANGDGRRGGPSSGGASHGTGGARDGVPGDRDAASGSAGGAAAASNNRSGACGCLLAAPPARGPWELGLVFGALAAIRRRSRRRAT